MAKLKVSLSIGYANASRNDVIDIDDDDIASCEDKAELDSMLSEMADEWASNYLDLGYELIDDGE